VFLAVRHPRSPRRPPPEHLHGDDAHDPRVRTAVPPRLPAPRPSRSRRFPSPPAPSWRPVRARGRQNLDTGLSLAAVTGRTRPVLL